MFYQKNLKGLPLFFFSELESLTGFVHAVTCKGTQDENRVQDPELDAESLAPVLQRLEIPPARFLSLQQIHSCNTVTVSGDFCRLGESRLGPADGFLVLRGNWFTGLRTADCLPILVVSGKQPQYAAFHAGWRGTRDRIVEKGLERFLALTSCSAEDLWAVIGPCIRSCCYQVGEEVRRQFQREGHSTDELFDDRLHLDLVAANRLQLERQGIRRIVDSGMCTACRPDLFYSFRRTGKPGRFWTIAGFREVQDPGGTGSRSARSGILGSSPCSSS